MLKVLKDEYVVGEASYFEEKATSSCGIDRRIQLELSAVQLIIRPTPHH
jgi:hypothetical protein